MKRSSFCSCIQGWRIKALSPTIETGISFPIKYPRLSASVSFFSVIDMWARLSLSSASASDLTFGSS
eukprot:9582785-Karenia_brevis.AAC.1